MDTYLKFLALVFITAGVLFMVFLAIAFALANYQ